MYPAYPLQMSLQSYVLLIRFSFAEWKRTETALTRFTLWDAEILGPSIQAPCLILPQLHRSCSCKDALLGHFQNTSSPIPSFRLLQSGLQLSHQLSQNIETVRQIMSASPPLTKPIFLFPFGPPEGNFSLQFSYKYAKEDHHPSPLSWGRWFLLFYELCCHFKG